MFKNLSTRIGMACLLGFVAPVHADAEAQGEPQTEQTPAGVLQAIDDFLAAGVFEAHYAAPARGAATVERATSLPRLPETAVRGGLRVSAGSLSRLFSLSDAALAAAAPAVAGASGGATASVVVDDFSPFMMLGWTLTPPETGSWSLSLNAGMAFADSASVERALACSTGLTEGACAQLQAQANDAPAATAEAFAGHDLFPLLSLGFSRRF